MKKIGITLLGCGDRGNVYTSYALKKPDEAEVIAVIDMDEVALKTTGDLHHIPEERRFRNLDDFLEQQIPCDTVINATMDSAHYETTLKLIDAGYHQLLEKPIVNHETELLEIQKRVREKGVSLLICHVLRYTPFYRSVKELINAGKIGKIMTMEMNEHVGTMHFADSFIRGKWSDEKDCGSGLLLQKCCHDMDLMCWLNGETKPSLVSSFGSRSYFTEENAPDGATEFCYQCPYNSTCLYDAKKIHLECDSFSFQTWRGIHKPLEEIEVDEKIQYLKESDYGRCVFKLKRELVDRQNVTIQFKNGSIGTLTVVGGSSVPGRDIHIVGTKGEIKGRLEDNQFKLFEYIHDNEQYEVKEQIIDLSAEIGENARHSNGDECLMHDYIRFLNGDTSSISITSIDDSIYGHLCVYAAEISRKCGKIQKLPDAF